jgi:hypothetical protein
MMIATSEIRRPAVRSRSGLRLAYAGAEVLRLMSLSVLKYYAQRTRSTVCTADYNAWAKTSFHVTT